MDAPNAAQALIEKIDAQILTASLLRRQLFEDNSKKETLLTRVYKYLFELTEELGSYKDSLKQIQNELFAAESKSPTKMNQIVSSLEDKIKSLNNSIAPSRSDTTVRDNTFLVKPLYEENTVQPTVYQTVENTYHPTIEHTVQPTTEPDALRVSNLLIKIYSDDSSIIYLKDKFGPDIINMITENALSPSELDEVEHTLQSRHTRNYKKRLSDSLNSSAVGRNKRYVNYTSPYSNYFDRSMMTCSKPSLSFTQSKKAKLRRKIKKDKKRDSSLTLFREPSWGSAANFFKSGPKPSHGSVARKVTQSNHSHSRKKVLI